MIALYFRTNLPILPTPPMFLENPEPSNTASGENFKNSNPCLYKRGFQQCLSCNMVVFMVASHKMKWNDSSEFILVILSFYTQWIRPLNLVYHTVRRATNSGVTSIVISWVNLQYSLLLLYCNTDFLNRLIMTRWVLKNLFISAQ